MKETTPTAKATSEIPKAQAPYPLTEFPLLTRIITRPPKPRVKWFPLQREHA
jgi:hypothetical protein